ncbi:pseudaminic acid cytidylyltransferase [Snuella lapsa]|uniref:Pseudaminic acid cytidylyltransferase n=1 Tax=Snuella lapsa TaxID=870481 RepID=A0ABP6XGY5_9FLAO
MSNLALIPARGGSKRIPRKNIKAFLGKPIISYSIEAALGSNLFEDVMVSTDDKEVAEISTSFGAQIPFFRSKDNADDFATLSDVIKEVILSYDKIGKKFENICCILPTAPFITSNAIIESFNKLISDKLDSVFPVLEFSYPIQRGLEFEGDKIKMVWNDYLNSRSQDLPKRYHDSGQYYWINTEVFLKEEKLFTNNSGAVVISELLSQDIDTEVDWKLAELKYNLMLRK